jgi:hypothetical protein
MPRKVEIDVDALNKAVADGVAKNARTMKTAHDDAAVEAGAAKSASVIEDVEKTFCGAWPKVNSFLDKILDNFAVRVRRLGGRATDPHLPEGPCEQSLPW